MSCTHCNQTIDETHRTLETPCCGVKYHSTCGIEKLGMALCHFASVFCDCGHLLYQHPHYTPVDEESIAVNIAEIKAKPGVPAELKVLKAKKVLMRKSFIAYKKYLKEKKAEFHELIDSQIEAIKMAKRTTQAQIKSSDTYKEYRKLQLSFHASLRKFKTTHNLNRPTMNRLIGSPYGRHWGEWAFRPLYLMTRSFRIRL
jgi:hypothetical protein